MILYHAISSYQLLEVITHKISYNNDKTTILCISFDVVRRLKNYEDLKLFFNSIVVYDNGVGNYSILQGREINSYFEGILKKENINLEKMEDIYLACGHHSFGIFVAQKNIPFVYFEDGAGAISRPEVLHRVESKFKRKDQLCLELGLYDGSNINIKKCICNFNYQKKDFKPKENYEHFDLYDALCALNSSDREMIIKIFTKISHIDVDKPNSVLILTEHFANLRVISWEEQIFLYQLYIDYFLPNKALIFKTHPDDLLYYKELFPGAQVINQKFPAELLPFLFKKKPDVISTISSTAIYGLSRCFDKFLVFDYNFTKKKEFYCLHKYYAALHVISSIGYSTFDIISYGADTVILNNFLLTKDFENLRQYKIRGESYLKNLKYNKKSIIIFDQPFKGSAESKEISKFLLTLDDESIVIFLNTDDTFCFYDYSYKKIWKNIIPVRLRKNKVITNVDSNVLDLVDKSRNFADEYVYIYTKGEFAVDKCNDKKALPYSGMDIEITTFQDKDLQIKRLEGILAATEKRLLYYIHKQNQQENK